MPASSSSRSALPWGKLAELPESDCDLLAGGCLSLADHLAQIPGPRDPRGVRHTLTSLLPTAVVAVLAGARSFAAIGEWIADAPPQVLSALGIRQDPLTGRFEPPDEATIRRVLERADAGVVDRAVGRGWLPGSRPGTAGAGSGRWSWTASPCAAPGTPAPMGKPPICWRFATRRLAPCWARPPWTARPARSPRSRRCLSRKWQWRTITVYGITSLTVTQASPADLSRWIRGHWAIEALYHIGDVTYREDGSQVRTANGPQVMAALRNLAIAIMKMAGHPNIAAATRYHARDSTRTLATLGLTR